MKLPKNITSLGFTLVELMVVISIISVLAATGAVVYSNVNRNNRDAARQRDLNSIKQALEFYFQTNNSYPATKYISTTNNKWIPELTPTYFDTIPQDPLNNSTYFYTYQPSTEEVSNSPTCTPSTSYQFYILYATLESGNITPPTLNACFGGTEISILLTSKSYYLLSQ